MSSLILPTEMWHQIMNFCSYSDYTQLVQVSREMGHVARSSESFSILKSPLITLKGRVPFASFCYDAKTKMLITGDYVESGQGEGDVHLWSRKRYIGEFVQEQRNFFRPITWVSVDHSKKEVVVVSPDGYPNPCGQVKIWDLDTRVEKTILKNSSFKLQKRFESIFSSENRQNLSGINIQELSHFFPGDRRENLQWAIQDRRIHRIFTAGRQRCSIKVWDSRSNQRITQVTRVYQLDATIYDHERSEIICVRNYKTLMIFDGKRGRVRERFMIQDPGTQLTAFDYCSKTGRLVAAYEKQTRRHQIDGIKIAVIDRRSRQIIASFSPIDPQSQCFYPILSLHYAPQSDTIVTGGYGVQLWDIKSGQIMRKITENEPNPIVHWEQEQRAMIILNRYAGTINRLDYSYIRQENGDEKKEDEITT